MEINVSQDGLTMGEGAVVESLKTRKLGFRLSFRSSENTMRSDVILTEEDAKYLIKHLQNSLDSAEKLKSL